MKGSAEGGGAGGDDMLYLCGLVAEASVLFVWVFEGSVVVCGVGHANILY